MYKNTAHATVELMMVRLMQLQFDLIHAQAIAHLPAFVMVLGCLHKVPIEHEY